MSDDALPLCACEQYYDSHHPECPARRAYEALASRLDQFCKLVDECRVKPAEVLDRAFDPEGGIGATGNGAEG